MDKSIGIKPVWVVLGLAGLVLVGLVVVGVAFASLGLLGSIFSAAPTPFPNPTAFPTPSPVSPQASIGGSVWHDLCAGGSQAQPDPSSAAPGCVWVDGGNAFAADAIRQPGEPGIAGVLVELGTGACPSIGLATSLTADDGSYSFAGISPGTYCLSIDPGLGANSSILAPGQWTAPERLSGRIQVIVAVGAGEDARPIDLGWDYQFLPPPEPSPVVSSTPTPGLTQCTDKSAFVLDVTIPDNSNIKAGSSFKKTWRIKNVGTCSWDTDYSFVFASGERMGGASPTKLLGPVAPGSTVDVTLDLIAPSANGAYKGNWLLRNPAGVLFGIGSQGDQPVWVQIVVGATATPVPAPWKAEFFDNRDLKGDPDLVRQDATIDFDWKRGAPARGIPEDNFSARWTGKFSFAVGTYRFSVLVDDGVRLWVDGQLVIDNWEDGGERELTAVVGLTKATHDIRLEYYDHTREARVRLTWDKVASPSYPDWKAEFWPNRDLNGDPILVRNDAEIDFDWGSNAPAVGVPVDNFSVRWSRKVTFDTGTYRFNIKADDGVRVYVDGQRVINEWHDSGGDTYRADLNLSGTRRIVVEYYERGGKALVHFWWVRPSPTPTPTATMTATPTATEVTDPIAQTQTPQPTATPTATEVTNPPTQTQTPEPTATPTSTSAPNPAIIIDFVAEACTASWKNGDQTLICPGNRGDAAGYVLRLRNPRLETGGRAGGAALLTAPQRVNVGRIEGTFPTFNVQSGDRFKARLGCLHERAECSGILEISYLTLEDEPGPRLLGSWNEAYDGQVTVVDLDLSSLAGKTVSFVMTARGAQGSSQNVPIWVSPAIWR